MLSACQQACQLIDMQGHVGDHPCMGAVDLVPIYPLGEEVGLEECGKEARGEKVFVGGVKNADGFLSMHMITCVLVYLCDLCPCLCMHASMCVQYLSMHVFLCIYV